MVCLLAFDTHSQNKRQTGQRRTLQIDPHLSGRINDVRHKGFPGGALAKYLMPRFFCQARKTAGFSMAHLMYFLAKISQINNI